ncbi:hypothetical protein [Deinococcus aerophilus]|uniref:Nucleotidyltransferase domain-containing protein n=1 Tax=Deinococcus aerophilus TaxID=522488 RepID=A0ABQ2GRE2_9DEIO|nr:hypothetical protein [Deinococcus aerophilus]GGM09272.1 hypothetical protein GCM10010841_17080 [Deinococcus aerophilus]
MITTVAQTRLKAALPAALERITATPGVYAALWCGSATRGEATPYSDLDFHALVTGGLRWRSNFTVDGVPVEVFHNPVHKVRAMFAEEDAATITMFAQGRPVLPHPELGVLIDEARTLYAAGPTPRPLTEAQRFHLIEEVMDGRGVLNQPIHSLLALSAANQAVDVLYAVNGWWEVKRERWPADLAARSPEVAHELTAVLVATDARSRQAALERLVTRLTGDLSYRDGGSGPEPVG